MHIFDGRRLDVGYDLGDPGYLLGDVHDLFFQLSIGENTRDFHASAVRLNVENDVTRARRDDQRRLYSRRRGEIGKGFFGLRGGLGLNTARGVGNEQRRGVVANAGRIDYQVVEQRVLPIDIEQRTQPPAAHSVQFF